MEGWVQEALARAIGEQPLVGLYLMIERRIVYANARTLEMFGLTEEMLPTYSISNMVAPESRPLLEAMVHERETSSAFTKRYVMRGLRTDGTTFDLEVYGSAFDTARGRVVAGTLLDVTERLVADRATAAAAASFRSLIEVSPDPMVVHIGGKILFANDATARVIGANSGAALTGMSLWSQTSREQRQMIIERNERLGAGVAVPPVEQTYRRLDDASEVTVEIATVPVVFEGQNAALAAAHDVTARKAAAREREQLIRTLEFERKRLTRLLDDAPAFISILRGPTHIFEFLNRAYSELVVGRDLLGKSFAEAFPELASQGYVAMLDRVYATGERYATDSAEVFLRASDSEVSRIVRFVCEPMSEADGTRTGVFVLGFDITDLHVATQALAVEERRYRRLFDAHPLPSLSWVEREGAFRLGDLNEAARAFLGRGEADPKGKRPSELFEEETEATLARALEENVSVDTEAVRTVTTLGQKRNLKVTLVPLQPDTVLAHVEDVTERRLLEERLRQTQKMEAVGVLAGGVAHDFNNLITVIRAACEFLEPVLEPGTVPRADLDQITKACETATQLTGQLLAFSRKQVLKLEVVDLDDVVTKTTPMLARLLRADVRIVRTLRARGRVRADVTQLEQVLLNLAANAQDAMPRGGTVTIVTEEIVLDAAAAAIRSARAGAHVVLAVRDTGTGMDEPTQKRIFEPFFTTKELGQGTGLGLATVYGIVEQLGGTITVESKVGEGTTFEILLPRYEGELRPTTPKSIPPVGEGKAEVVLLVDDDDGIRRACKRTLERAGYVVHDAADGVEALGVAARIEGPIDLVLTDVVMPRMGARELAEQLRRVRPKQKFVFMSGHTDDALVRRGIAENETRFLAKPFTPKSLLGVIRDSLES